MAPQPGLEPGTLRLTGGKSVVSRTLPQCAGRRRIGQRHSENRTICGFRCVPPFAVVFRSLLHRLGKNWATSHEDSPLRDEADRVAASIERRRDLATDLVERPRPETVEGRTLVAWVRKSHEELQIVTVLSPSTVCSPDSDQSTSGRPDGGPDWVSHLLVDSDAAELTTDRACNSSSITRWNTSSG
jgi:hypothetical protein